MSPAWCPLLRASGVRSGVRREVGSRRPRLLPDPSGSGAAWSWQILSGSEPVSPRPAGSRSTWGEGCVLPRVAEPSATSWDGLWSVNSVGWRVVLIRPGCRFLLRQGGHQNQPMALAGVAQW